MFFINRKLHSLMEQYFQVHLKERAQMDEEYDNYPHGPYADDPEMESIVGGLQEKFGKGADPDSLYELAKGIKGGEFGFDEIDNAIEGLSILDEVD